MGRFDVGAEFPTATVGASAGRPKARRSLRWASNRKAQLSEPWTDYGLMTQLSSDSISATRPSSSSSSFSGMACRCTEAMGFSKKLFMVFRVYHLPGVVSVYKRVFGFRHLDF